MKGENVELLTRKECEKINQNNVINMKNIFDAKKQAFDNFEAE